MNLHDRLLTLEEELLSPATRHDPARLAELLAPDFLEFGSSGRIFTFATILAELAADGPSRTVTLSGFSLLAHTADWAIVTYRTLRRDPSAADVAALRSSTWVHRNGRWQMLFHQGTLTSSATSPHTIAP